MTALAIVLMALVVIGCGEGEELLDTIANGDVLLDNIAG